MKLQLRRLVASTLFLLLIPGFSFAEVCEARACFKETIVVDGKELPLRGLSLFKYWGFAVYVAGLYVPEDVAQADILKAETPKYLILNYRRGLSAENIKDNSEHILKKTPGNNMNELRERLDQLYGWYKDVNEGDRFALRYSPEEGTTLLFNEQELGTLRGEDFHRAYFGIWLSPNHSVSDSFTRRLVRGKE